MSAPSRRHERLQRTGYSHERDAGTRRKHGAFIANRAWVPYWTLFALTVGTVFAVRPAGAQVVLEYDSAAHRPGQRAELSYSSSRNRILKGAAGARIMRPPNEVDLRGDGLDIEVRNLLVVLTKRRSDSRIAIGVLKPASIKFPAGPLAASPSRADSVVLQAEGLRLRIARPVILRQDGDTLRLKVLVPN